MESARLLGLGDAAALINEGLYQLGAHDWCVSAGTVTQLGAGRRETPLFTEHKERKQAAATSAPPSVNSRAFHENLPLQQRAAHRPAASNLLPPLQKSSFVREEPIFKLTLISIHLPVQTVGTG